MSFMRRHDYKVKQYLGLKNLVVSATDFKYLLFYELDTTSADDYYKLINAFEPFPISYIIYTTKNGFHVMGLTPINAQQWGNWFQSLSNFFKEYYGGQTLRWSAKSHEQQNLLYASFNYPYVGKLVECIAKRFNIKDIPQFGRTYDHAYTIEKYWSEKD